MMHQTNDSRYRLNGPMDDVANNIRADQQEPPDPNPLLECHGCGENYQWDHYKNHGKAPEKPGDAMLCAACNGFGTVGVKSTDERRENNRQLGEWSGWSE